MEHLSAAAKSRQYRRQGQEPHEFWTEQIRTNLQQLSGSGIASSSGISQEQFQELLAFVHGVKNYTTTSTNSQLKRELAEEQE